MLSYEFSQICRSGGIHLRCIFFFVLKSVNDNPFAFGSHPPPLCKTCFRLQDARYLLPLIQSQADHLRGGLSEEALMNALISAGYQPPPGNDEENREALMTELQDLVLQSRSPDGEGPLVEPKRYSVRWYQAYANHPVVPGCKVTVLQMSYFIVRLAREGGMTVDSVNSLCKALHFADLMTAPKENRMPKCAPMDVNALHSAVNLSKHEPDHCHC